ncbi:MAG: alanine racemase, partial [Longimicrobiales bacterium]
ILAVIKNNAYGLGPTGAARILSNDDVIAGFAVVKSKDAIALREARIQSDILLMGMAPADVHLSLYQTTQFASPDAPRYPQRYRNDHQPRKT